MDTQLFSVLPAVHSLTGCDITSKVGTKKAALAANPIKYLTSFGKSSTLRERDIELAEKYLVKVLKGEGDDFMSLRVYMFNFSKGSSHLNLPSTSMALLPHIKRSFWYTYDITHILDEQRTILNPEHYGFIMIDSLLLPERVLSKIDERYTEICKNCTNCSRKLVFAEHVL